MTPNHEFRACFAISLAFVAAILANMAFLVIVDLLTFSSLLATAAMNIMIVWKTKQLRDDPPHIQLDVLFLLLKSQLDNWFDHSIALAMIRKENV